MACAVIVSAVVVNMIVANCAIERVRGAALQTIPAGSRVDQFWVFDSGFRPPRRYAIVHTDGQVVELQRIRFNDVAVPSRQGFTVVETTDERIGPDWTWNSVDGFKPLRQ